MFAYETYSMAFEKPLDDPRVTGKGDSSVRLLASRGNYSRIMCRIGHGNVLPGQPLQPVGHSLQIFTDASGEGWGAHLDNYTPMA